MTQQRQVAQRGGRRVEHDRTRAAPCRSRRSSSARPDRRERASRGPSRPLAEACDRRRAPSGRDDRDAVDARGRAPGRRRARAWPDCGAERRRGGAIALRSAAPRSTPRPGDVRLDPEPGDDTDAHHGERGRRERDRPSASPAARRRRRRRRSPCCRRRPAATTPCRAARGRGRAPSTSRPAPSSPSRRHRARSASAPTRRSGSNSRLSARLIAPTPAMTTKP